MERNDGQRKLGGRAWEVPSLLPLVRSVSGLHPPRNEAFNHPENRPGLNHAPSTELRPTVNNTIDFQALNAHIVTRANAALTLNNKTVVDAAEWLELPMSDTQARLDGTTEFYLPEVMCIATALGEQASEWFASSGLVD